MPKIVENGHFLVQLIVENVVTCFFETQCSNLHVQKSQ